MASTATLVQPEQRAGPHPVPPLRFLRPPTQRIALSPFIAFTDVPDVQFQDHLVGFQGQFQLGRRRPARLRVELLAHQLGMLSLPVRLAVQRGNRELQPGQVLQHLGRLLHRHWAGQQAS